MNNVFCITMSFYIPNNVYILKLKINGGDGCGDPTQLWISDTNSLIKYLGRVFYSTFGCMYLSKSSKG
jgi:hypothetical protein